MGFNSGFKGLKQSDRYYENVNNGAVGSKEIKAKLNRANKLKFKCEGFNQSIVPSFRCGT